MSLKDCGNHKRHKLYRRIFWSVIAFIITILLIILIIYLVLRPTKPKFYLQDATVQEFNLTDHNLLTSTIQVSIYSRNPNDRIGIFYDKLDVYASYKDQQITLPYSIPPFYQGHNDVTVWSPYLNGDAIPIAPFLGVALEQDEADGFFFLFVKIDARLRWKVGSWTSDEYHLFVNCPAYLSFDHSKEGGSSPSIRFQQISTCSVDI